jgi:multiple sugar transport system ATP-binding protein
MLFARGPLRVAETRDSAAGGARSGLDARRVGANRHFGLVQAEIGDSRREARALLGRRSDGPGADQELGAGDLERPLRTLRRGGRRGLGGSLRWTSDGGGGLGRLTGRIGRGVGCARLLAARQQRRGHAERQTHAKAGDLEVGPVHGKKRRRRANYPVYHCGSQMASSVRLEQLTRRFPGSDRAAVDGIDLSVAEGEVVALVGPSGCGKSTTLRMVAGLELPDSGMVRIGRRDMTRVPPQDRDVAMVFQGFALYPHMKVRDILAFPLKMRKQPVAERERAVAEAAELLGITRLLDRRPGQLSGGEQQRVAMGRAIVRKPEVFLFDEPLSNLDAALRAELRIELGRLLRRLKATALYVTHDQAEAMTLADRIAVLRAGRLEQLDTPRVIYEAPASVFVASFFGVPPMNLLDVEAGRAGGFELGGLELPGAELVLGVRPEHVRIDAATSDGISTEAEVTAAEPLGAETHLELESGGSRLRCRVPGFESPAPGARVRASFSARHVHWFDRTTGLALARSTGAVNGS